MQSEKPTTVPVDPNEDIDGLYRYQWKTRFGIHWNVYRVIDGIIQPQLSIGMSPMKLYEGRKISDFARARLQKDWKFTGDSFCRILSSEGR